MAPERFFTVVRASICSIKKRSGVWSADCCQKTDRDDCFVGIYYRAKANVESLLSLKYLRDFQASIMLARSLFELAVDMKLIDVDPGRH